MKRRKILMIVMVLGMLFVMAGCSDKKQEEQYEKSVVDLVADITDENEALINNLRIYLDNLKNEENKNAIISNMDKMVESYTKLQSLEAPERYKEAQNILSDAVTEALKGTDCYREAIQSCTVDTPKDKALYDAFLEKIKEGDKYISSFNTKVVEAGKLIDRIDQ